MPMTTKYSQPEPAREAVDTTPGPLVLEFGVDWCPHCQAAQAPLAEALDAFADVAHTKIEDGKGRPLGRSFGIKLWPTLVFLRDGREVSRLVRPREAAPIRDALAALG